MQDALNYLKLDNHNELLIMADELPFRRQFILTRQKISGLSHWEYIDLDQYYLYVHPDLEVTLKSDSFVTLILLGYLFDPLNYQASNKDIMRQVFEENHNFASVIMSLKTYTGRYIAIYKDSNSFNIVQDALSLRELYYCQKPNNVVCASQPNLIERFAQPSIFRSADPEILKFVHDQLQLVRNGRLWPGDGTAYEDVKHLLPNHYLDTNKLQSVRYWPNSPVSRLALEDAIEKSATFLKGALQAAAYRRPLMLAVTAGYDSRALLAASKTISQSVYYFINKIEYLNEGSNDIRIPKEIFKHIGLPFHIHTYSKGVPAYFKDIFLSNTFFAHDHLLPVIYNIYYKQHNEKLNILGVGEVGRTKFFDPPKNLDAYYLAYMLKHRRSSYAVKECATWLAAAKPVAVQYNLNIMTLFWWEVLIGNWGSVGNSESDIAIEEFDPYNSHFLYETFLSVDPKYRTFNDNILFKELIRYMWPQLLDFPVNPPENYNTWRPWILQKLGIETMLRYLKFTIYHLLYQFYWSKHSTT